MLIDMLRAGLVSWSEGGFAYYNSRKLITDGYSLTSPAAVKIAPQYIPAYIADNVAAFYPSACSSF